MIFRGDILMKRLILLISMLFMPLMAHAAEGVTRLDLTSNWVGITSAVLFFIAYLAVMAEEFTLLRKSKPVMLAAGIIWALIAWYYQAHDIPHLVETALRHNLEEYAELMLFLIVAMTYINAMEERNVFEALRSWLISKGFSYRVLFWVTGWIAFFLSGLADNLTTALLMGAVVVAVGHGNRKFVVLGCINLVIAANAGGAFSPFGDITTLMVWQKEHHCKQRAGRFLDILLSAHTRHGEFRRAGGGHASFCAVRETRRWRRDGQDETRCVAYRRLVHVHHRAGGKFPQQAWIAARDPAC